MDLGSSNGTWIGDQRVDKIPLHPGDEIRLGSATLRFSEFPSLDEPDLTVIESEDHLNEAIQSMTIPMTIHETFLARLAVHTPDRTFELPLLEDSQIIGRQEGNDLVLDFERVSRKHARIIRRGADYILEDLGSTNGTWFSGKRVDTHTLQNGDSIRIGATQLVFKAGFHPEELTIAEDTPSAARDSRRPVIFLPGLMGSQLWRGSERVWPNVKLLLKDPEALSMLTAPDLEPRGIVNEIVIVPNLVKMEQYNRLGDFMVEELGYERGKDFFEFAYDWRQDVRQSARRLGEMIEQLDLRRPVTLIGHSLGTLVSRYYVEKLGGSRLVERVILMGGPHAGAPKAATSLLFSPRLLPFGLMGERLRQVMASFPSSYQILPMYLCTTDQHGQQINILEDTSWLSSDGLPHLQAAAEFRRELGQRSSIPAVSIFGYGLKTVTGIRVERLPSGGWKKIDFTMEPSGDSTVPERSAILEGSEIHPVQQYHGSLFVDNDVKMRLKIELNRP